MQTSFLLLLAANLIAQPNSQPPLFKEYAPKMMTYYRAPDPTMGPKMLKDLLKEENIAHPWFEKNGHVLNLVAAQLGWVIGRLEALMAEPRSASERLRRLFSTMVENGLALYFNERKLHEIVTAAVTEHWSAVRHYQRTVLEMIRTLVTEGRAAGEFERKTPLEDAAAAINATLTPFMHPILLEQADPEELPLLAERVANLVLRSLAP